VLFLRAGVESVRDQVAQQSRFKPEYQVIANLPENASIEELCTGLDGFRTYFK